MFVPPQACDGPWFMSWMCTRTNFYDCLALVLVIFLLLWISLSTLAVGHMERLLALRRWSKAIRTAASDSGNDARSHIVFKRTRVFDLNGAGGKTARNSMGLWQLFTNAQSTSSSAKEGATSEKKRFEMVFTCTSPRELFDTVPTSHGAHVILREVACRHANEPLAIHKILGLPKPQLGSASASLSASPSKKTSPSRFDTLARQSASAARRKSSISADFLTRTRNMLYARRHTATTASSNTPAWHSPQQIAVRQVATGVAVPNGAIRSFFDSALLVHVERRELQADDSRAASADGASPANSQTQTHPSLDQHLRKRRHFTTAS